MICRHCKQTINYRTLQCPHCAEIQWRTLTAATVVVFFGLVIADVALPLFVPHRARAGTAPHLPVVTISARKLYTAYHTDPGAMNRRFAGHMVRISGVVTSIAQDFANRPVVSLQSRHHVNDQMTMRDSERAAAGKLHTGEKVVIDCARMSSIMGIPEGSGCTFESSSR
ncbi:MAG: OB-fold protein [Acidiferrobacter sp.]